MHDQAAILAKSPVAVTAHLPPISPSPRICRPPEDPDMPALPVPLQTALLLVCSNIFMTFAWYAHLRHLQHRALPWAILFSWGIAFFEYCFQVPANRIGSYEFSAVQLKTIQEVITLTVFSVFSVLYLDEQIKWNYIVGFVLLVAAVFAVLSRNCDDHTKNVSFLLREGAGWELAPAYDVTHAYNPKGEWTYQHLMSVNGKFAGIARDDLLLLADRFAIGTAVRVLERVGEAVSAWPDFATKAKVSAAERDRIRAHHQCPLP